MCVVSMVMDSQWDNWWQRYYVPTPPPTQPIIIPTVWPVVLPPRTPSPLPTPQEIDEFRRLLDRAREYDRKNNEPDCELEEKRGRLKALAKELGVEIDFA